MEALMQVKRAGTSQASAIPGYDRPSVNRQVIGSSPIAGAQYLASDQRKCVAGSIRVGLVGVCCGDFDFRFGFAGLVRSADDDN